MTPRARTIFLLTFLLLLIAAAHGLRLRGLEMNPDEIWSIWQTFGTPAEIVAWTPYDWTPLYYLTLGGWRLAVGIHPIALRVLSVLLSLLGAAFAYRAGQRLARQSLARQTLAGYRAGILSMLIYAALPYSIFLSGYVRPYALAHALVPLSFWLVLRYFGDDTHTISRHGLLNAALLTVTLVASFYTTLVAPVAAFFFGVFTLIRDGLRRSVRLWLPVGVAFVLCSLPIVLPRVSLVVDRVGVLAPLRPFGTAIAGILHEYTGDLWPVWAALLLAGLIYAFRALRRSANAALGRTLIGLAAWGFGGLAIMYVAHPVLGFFNPSYSFWALTGMALFGGVLLAALPRPAWLVVAGIVTVLLFVPPPERLTRNYAAPGVSVFSWLHEPGHMLAGDAVIIDPNFTCLATYELDYLTRAFFPQGLHYVENAGDTRRVWYAADVGSQDAATAAEVAQGRVERLSTGPANCLWRLYEAPPDPDGILFENGMRFHGAELIDRWTGAPLAAPRVVREGETFRVRLWWSVDTPPSADYSVGVHVLNSRGELIAQTDSAPAVREVDPSLPPETSQWQPGRFYVEERAITLRYPLKTNTYALVLTVYQWWDGTRIAAPGVDEQNLLTLLRLDVKSWHEGPND